MTVPCGFTAAPPLADVAADCLPPDANAVPGNVRTLSAVTTVIETASLRGSLIVTPYLHHVVSRMMNTVIFCVIILEAPKARNMRNGLV
jgi:hypothetical protein